MAASLEARTGHTFHFIGAVADLSVERLQAIRPRFVFFPHWSHRIDARIHKQFECVIFHMTDLPFGRGGSPLQNLIARGIYDTRISALRCVEEMDAGPVYLKAPLSLYGSAEEIFVRAARIIEDLIVEILRTQPEPVAQSGVPTVFTRRKPEESDLAGAQSLDELFDRIRMLDADGYPHAFLDAGPFRLEFTRASRKSGSVVADVRVTLVDRRK
jgi:methionyl-tRNA formyltransferase